MDQGLSSAPGDNTRQPPTPRTYCKESLDEETPSVAIVGMALRLPGGIRSPESFRDFLLRKDHGHGIVPASRYKIDSFYSDSRPGSVKTKHGYFLQEDPGLFDAPFFGVSSSEAAHMDPQQRQLMEVIWECFESAGETEWQGKDVGCYVGVFGEDWLGMVNRDQLNVDRYRAFAAGNFALSNRMSYEFDFKGPSMTIETGCSASLVGLHEACQALLSKECSSAIVAGTNLIFTPTMTTTMSENMVLSPDGRCKTFDQGADGYGRGEAINAIYIKRFEDAIQNKDPIRAVIRATSTNSDGRKPLITNPNAESQEQLVRKAYKRAGIKDISQTAFFECHGTGTIAGDAAEASAVADLFQPEGVFIGSVKSNIGHSEGASGITSIIKAALSLEHNMILPNVFYETPSANIAFQEGKLQVPTEPIAWPANRRERVSVNSFGIGGANAHAILDSSQSFCSLRCDTSRHAQTDDTSLLLAVSASNPASLRERIRDITQYANDHPSRMQDLVHTLGSRRQHLSHRAFATVCQDRSVDESSFQSGQAKSTEAIFTFTGQGAQWAGMGRDLMKTFPLFKENIRRMDEALQGLDDPPSWSLEDELQQEDSKRISNTELSQTLCTALQIGLVNLLRTFGVTASSVVGHSSGEIAAAYASGAITARSAIVVAYYRGKLAKSQENSGGAMAVIGMNRDAIAPYLEDGVVVACENSPQNITLSGNSDIIDRVLARLKAELPDVFCRRLRVTVAYHSHHMKRIGETYKSSISQHIETQNAMLPLFSSTTSEIITKASDLGASYWRRNLESPVLFTSAVQRILQSKGGNFAFIEIGPHTALSGPLRQIFQAQTSKSSATYIPTMTRNDDASREQILFTVGCVFNTGLPVLFSTINGTGRALSDLPTYPWQHKEKFWEESRLSREWRHRSTPCHELLGARVIESPDSEPSWRNLLRLNDASWLSDHVVQGNVIFPAAGYIAMVGEAIQQLSPSTDSFLVKDLILMAPLILTESKATEIITTFKPVKYTDLVDSDRFAFSIHTHDGTEWTKHCQGQVKGNGTFTSGIPSVKNHFRQVNAEKWYRVLNKQGLQYGPSFRGLTDISADPVEYVASATIFHEEDTRGSRYMLHPTVIDQCLQLLSVACVRGVDRCIDRMAIPAAIGRISVRAGESRMRVAARAGLGTDMNEATEVVLIGGNEPVLVLDKPTLFPMETTNDSNFSRTSLGATIKWTPDVDLLLQKSLLPPTPVPEIEYNIVKYAGRIGSFFVLQTVEKLKGFEPTVPHMAKWRDWINEKSEQILESKACLLKDGESLQTLTDRFAAKYGKDSVVPVAGECVQVVYDNCLDFALGKTSPLEILLEDNRFEAYYNIGHRVRPWADFLRLLGTCKPGIRILEIGAGTGAATMMALKDLHTPEGARLYSMYTFSDISPGFLPAAQEKLAQYQGIEYKALDISCDPEEQGFDCFSFDLIIASNVLHATPSLQSTVRNVHKLLAPGGWLLLHELNPEFLTTDYIMGVLPGWWIGENDGRPDKPYVAPSRWIEELQHAGFSQDPVWTYDQKPPYQINFTMLAQMAPQSAGRPGVFLLTLGTPHPWAEDVASQFRNEGHLVKWGTLDDELPSDQLIISFIDLEGPFFHDMSSQNFELMQRYISKADEGCQFLWVTRSTQMSCEDPRFGSSLGFLRVLRMEKNLRVSIFESETFDDASGKALLDVYEKIRTQATGDSPPIYPETEFAFKDGLVYVPRVHWTDPQNLLSAAPDSDDPCRLDVGMPSQIHTLKWSRVPEAHLEKGQVEIDLHFVGLNFHDIMVAMGFFGSTDEFGIEGGGIVRRVGPEVKNLRAGDRVIAISPGMFRTRTTLSQEACVRIPDDVTIEDASTMGCVFATAIYSLVHLGNLKSGQTVLLHSACGGVGLASIQICHLIGAEIFATVGSEEKVEYLMENFAIPRNRIFNSRNAGFLPDILQATNGRGVDIVLNSLAGELLHASWECVARYGKMIELGKRDFLTNGMLSMAPFLKNRAFLGVDMLEVAQFNPELIHGPFLQAIDWLNEGKIKPIRPVKTFEAVHVVDAFRYMQQGVHMGKILVKMAHDTSGSLCSGEKETCIFSSNASYLLAGGLGGLGRAMSTWMVENGARHLVYLSPSAGKPENHQAFLRELDAQGCQVTLVAGSVASDADVARAISSCTKGLAGVIQLAMCLNDRSLEKMTYEEWTAALAPKVRGTWNLHHATLDSQLDFFVTLGSVSGVCGRATQANYAAANTFLDAFHKYRSQLGLPSSVLTLGVVEEIGFVSHTPRVLQTTSASSIRLLTEAEVIEGLKVAICQSSQPIGSGVLDSNSCIIGLGNTKPKSHDNVHRIWKNEARFGIYDNMELEIPDQPQMNNLRLKAFLADIERAPSILDEPESEIAVRRELGDAIGSHMAHTEGMDEEEKANLVIDSLMAIEIKRWLHQNLKIEIAVADIGKAKTVRGLASLTIERLKARYATETDQTSQE